MVLQVVANRPQYGVALAGSLGRFCHSRFSRKLLAADECNLFRVKRIMNMEINTRPIVSYLLLVDHTAAMIPQNICV